MVEDGFGERFRNAELLYHGKRALALIDPKRLMFEREQIASIGLKQFGVFDGECRGQSQGTNIREQAACEQVLRGSRAGQTSEFPRGQSHQQ